MCNEGVKRKKVDQHGCRQELDAIIKSFDEGKKLEIAELVAKYKFNNNFEPICGIVNNSENPEEKLVSRKPC